MSNSEDSERAETPTPEATPEAIFGETTPFGAFAFDDPDPGPKPAPGLYPSDALFPFDDHTPREQ